MRWALVTGVQTCALPIFGFGKVDGRTAIQRIALEGAAKVETIFAHPEVDVSDILRIGQGGRVVGAVYSTEKPRTVYFAPRIQASAAQLEKALTSAERSGGKHRIHPCRTGGAPYPS